MFIEGWDIYLISLFKVRFPGHVLAAALLQLFSRLKNEIIKLKKVSKNASFF